MLNKFKLSNLLIFLNWVLDAFKNLF